MHGRHLAILSLVSLILSRVLWEAQLLHDLIAGHQVAGLLASHGLGVHVLLLGLRIVRGPGNEALIISEGLIVQILVPSDSLAKAWVVVLWHLLIVILQVLLDAARHADRVEVLRNVHCALQRIVRMLVRVLLMLINGCQPRRSYELLGLLQHRLRIVLARWTDLHREVLDVAL